MNRYIEIILCTLWLSPAVGQDSLKIIDSGNNSMPSGQLSEVVVKAFEINGRLISQPAPISFIPATSLDRYSPASIVSDINTLPGIRMEERSPSSYRLNIRGSSVQSPFGVRDVKIYYNNIPVTDPTGDTYLNQFSYTDFGNIEIIRGSVGSAYGAGIGGTMLLTSPLLSIPDSGTLVSVRAVTGSFGMAGTDESLQWGTSTARNRLAYSDLKATGYRDHTASDLQTLSFETAVKTSGKDVVDVIAHYTDLYYQTPGGLTLKEFKENPRMARPAAAGFPSAANSLAAVFQKNFFAGVDQQYQFSDHLQNTTSVYCSYTDFNNPTIRNYENRKEPHFGGRTVFTAAWKENDMELSLVGGMELQQGYFNQTDFGNTSGSPDTLQTDYNSNNISALGFIQGDLRLRNGWDIQMGGSLNYSSIQLHSLYPSPPAVFQSTFHNEFIPRIGLSKTFVGVLSLYANVSQGFSPPTLSQLLPGTNVFNATLHPERGTDIDLGSRGSLMDGRLYYDMDFFIFNLNQSISERTDSSGEDYYVNAGGTVQHGLEAYLSYKLLRLAGNTNNGLTIWTSQDWSHFMYSDYQVLHTQYSGNMLPGVAPYTMAAGIDLLTKAGFIIHVIANYQSRLPLNDANSAFANPYTLVDLKIGWHHAFSRRFLLEIDGGVNNLLNQQYSLGDDINAAAGRYYNVAPGTNYFLNLGLGFRH